MFYFTAIKNFMEFARIVYPYAQDVLNSTTAECKKWASKLFPYAKRLLIRKRLTGISLNSS
jgi:hypothetical protein